MKHIHLWLTVLSFVAVARASIKDIFSKGCTDAYSQCMLCANITIPLNESLKFKSQSQEISNETCIMFIGGNMGEVNGYFFKQFPFTKNMTFFIAKMNLTSSLEKIEDHEQLLHLGIINSKITGNEKSNAFHSLKKLTTFFFKNNTLETTTLDKILLQNNANLEYVTLVDEMSRVVPKEDNPRPVLKNIEEGFFDHLKNLVFIELIVHGITKMPSFKDKTKLLSVHYEGILPEFPEDLLPETLTSLKLVFSSFKKLTKQNFRNLTNLTQLTILSGQLDHIDEDCFEELDDLMVLNLYDNNIKYFSAKHLEKNKKVKEVDLIRNPTSYLCNLENVGVGLTHHQKLRHIKGLWISKKSD